MTSRSRPALGRVDEGIGVLHVDDDAEFASLTAEFLEREDNQFEVITETSATDALERLREEQVQCIVSDYEMPGQNGLEFLESVRQRYPEIPFVLFTGKGSEDIASEAISAGVTDYLQKGTGQHQYAVLANRIRNAVRGFRSRKQVRELHEATRDLMDADVFEEVAACGVEAAEEILGLQVNAFYAPGEDDRALVPVAATDQADSMWNGVPPVDEPRGIAWTVFESGEPIFSADIGQHPETLSDDPKVKSEMLIPVGSHGVFIAASTGSAAFDETEKDLARVLAFHLEHALDSVSTARQLADAADVVVEDLRPLVDDLTNRLAAHREVTDDSLEEVIETLEDLNAVVDEIETLTAARSESEE